MAGAPSAKRPFPLCVWAIVSLAARGQPTLQALTLAPSGAQERPPRRPPPPTLLHGSEHSTITELAMGPRAQLTNRWRPGGQNPACSNLCSQTLHFLLTNRSSDLPVPGRAEVTSRAVRTGVCPCPWTAAAGGEGLTAQPARAGHTACPLTRCHARTERLLGTGHGSLESVLPLRSLRLGPGSEAAEPPEKQQGSPLASHMSARRARPCRREKEEAGRGEQQGLRTQGGWKCQWRSESEFL